MRQTILFFGSLSAIIFVLFELNKLSLLSPGNSSDVFVVLSGVLFILIGVLINKFLFQKKSSQKFLKPSNLSKQEHKVLGLMTNGLSNNEIADQLFIAESTVKTHVSNILSKLNAKRRTEAVKIGRDLNIV